MSASVLGELCQFTNGGTPSKAIAEFWNGDVPWISSADINDGAVILGRSFVTGAGLENSAANRVRAGTILIVSRTGIGKVAEAPISLSFSQDITAVEPDDSKLDRRYLLRFLEANKSHFESHARGATIKGITREAISQLKIPLPPLAEQRRIAAILDKADALRRKRKRALDLLDSMTQSTFMEMFGDPLSNPKRWPILKLGDLIHKASDGPHVSPDYSESGIPFLSTRHIQKGTVLWEDLKFIDREQAEIHWKKCRPERGDILYTKGGRRAWRRL